MTNFQIINSSDSPIAFTVTKGDKKEDAILYASETREMERTSASRIDFAVPVNISFRQKKAISEKLKMITKVVKELHSNVRSLDLPDSFIALKVKKVIE